MIEKYRLIKNTAIDTGIVDDVKLALTEENAMQMVDNVKSTSLIVFPLIASINTVDDSVQFRLMFLDKVNNHYEEENVLNSWKTLLTALRLMTNHMNYKEGEDVLVDDVSFGAYYAQRDDDVEYMLATIDVVLDMSYLTGNHKGLTQ
jgi:hypothetical protein